MNPYLIQAVEILTPPGARCAIVNDEHQTVAKLLQMIDEAPNVEALAALWAQWTEAGLAWRDEYTTRGTARADALRAQALAVSG